VRWLAFFCLIFSVTTVCGQEQERSLIDRLLRPNTELKNRQYGKAFRADSKVTTRSGAPKSFVLDSAREEKAFVDTHRARTKEYRSRSNRTDAGQKSFAWSRKISVPTQQMTSSSLPDVHPAYDANLNVAGRRFADGRSFRDQGKSQKSLDRQNPPLTIDQVRELLNKNK
jgi:hypothetical protein